MENVMEMLKLIGDNRLWFIFIALFFCIGRTVLQILQFSSTVQLRFGSVAIATCFFAAFSAFAAHITAEKYNQHAVFSAVVWTLIGVMQMYSQHLAWQTMKLREDNEKIREGIDNFLKNKP